MSRVENSFSSCCSHFGAAKAQAAGGTKQEELINKAANSRIVFRHAWNMHKREGGGEELFWLNVKKNIIKFIEDAVLLKILYIIK